MAGFVGLASGGAKRLLLVVEELKDSRVCVPSMIVNRETPLAHKHQSCLLPLNGAHSHLRTDFTIPGQPTAAVHPIIQATEVYALFAA